MAALGVAAIVLALIVIASSGRLPYQIKIDSTLTEDADDSTAAHTVLEGRMLGDFKLGQQLHHFDLPDVDEQRNSSGSLLQEEFLPLEEVGVMPNGLKLGRFLGKGEWGTYEAERGGETFVVKFIYQMRNHPKTGQKQPVFATGKDAAENEVLKGMMDTLSEECEAMQKLQSKKDINPEGAERIMKCIYRCFPGSPECPRTDDQPHFIVMEQVGENGYQWLQSHLKDKRAIVGVLKDIAIGVGYLSTTLDPPAIHHDLKWQNIYVKKVGDGWLGILVDLEDLVRVLADSSKQKGYTPGFAPPEVNLGWCYKKPAWSYDVYSLGAMTLMGLCGIPYSGLKKYNEWATGAVRNGVEKVMNTQIRSQLRKMGNGTSKKCCASQMLLLHPDATKRIKPDKIVFAYPKGLGKKAG